MLDAIMKEQAKMRIRDRELKTIVLKLSEPWWKKVFR